ncbi:hypothetical protein [Pigmentiphaga sp.]|uniref:hypothetical protein n=1 Tax=Pigmentiphaga sp. TaxID=1977564 RepID=UPI0025F4FE5F|nr:hypothetical protein [Pigmentiphaga sp.]
MNKADISDDTPEGQPLYAHLEVVVDYLIANGNSLAHTYRWGSNREGYFCHVLNSINFDGLVAAFNFPSSVVFGRERNVVYSKKTGCIIQTVANVV